MRALFGILLVLINGALTFSAYGAPSFNTTPSYKAVVDTDRDIFHYLTKDTCRCISVRNEYMRIRYNSLHCQQVSTPDQQFPEYFCTNAAGGLIHGEMAGRMYEFMRMTPSPVPVQGDGMTLSKFSMMRCVSIIDQNKGSKVDGRYKCKMVGLDPTMCPDPYPTEEGNPPVGLDPTLGPGNCDLVKEM